MHNDQLNHMRHSAAHLLAQAVLELFPGTLTTIGPVTDDGFFYDFLPAQNFKEEDLVKIEARMHELAKKNLAINQKEVSKTEAQKIFKDNKYKLELIKDIPGDTVGLAIQGDFTDLCKGGHVKTTGEIKFFKLLHISGSYWRADRENQALQRITGTAFVSEKDLKEYEQKREEALLYDHRRIGKDLNLFSFHDEGAGFPFYHPRGKKIINTMTTFIRREMEKEGYHEIQTPIVLSEQLWHQSGHYAHYKPNMYFLKIDDIGHAVKPMNCPGCILVYKTHPHSYRELPLRLSEFGLVHRHELSGVLHGLFRVRAFTQDDAHIFCTPDQIESEILSVLNFVKRTYKHFGFEEVYFVLATKPANAMGDEQLWEKATNALKQALEHAEIKYDIDEGGGAFYGPKIDVKINDSMGRLWQTGTIQVDFFMPQNFDLAFINNEGKKERPVMIHRAVYGSLERFFGVLLEHYKGKLPFWLSPVQVKVIPVSDKQLEHAQKITQQLQDAGMRTEVATASDPLQAKIKDAQLEQIPWMVIIGNKEIEKNTLTLRHRDGTQETDLTVEALIRKAQTS